MNSYIKFVFSIPKILWVNFRFLPINQAYKIPILLAYNVSIRARRNNVVIKSPVKFGMIHIGFHEISFIESRKTLIEVDGKLVFEGTAYLGIGTKIKVYKDAEMVLGDDFKVSSSSSFKCFKKMIFGRNIQFAWDCIVMDTDSHKIYDERDEILNQDKAIVFGNDIWIGCRCTILKGANIPNNCVIGSMSLVSGTSYKPNSIIAGIPARSIKQIGGWKL